MDINKYGPFASTIAVAAALVAVFSMLLIKAVGRVASWAWLVQDTPPFIVTVGARALAVSLIAIAFLTINKENYIYFSIFSIASGIVAIYFIAKFDRLRRIHTYRVPNLNADGMVEIDSKGRVVGKVLVIGTVSDMKPQAKASYDATGGLSLVDFLGGFGARKTNNPEAVWSRELLGAIANRMTIILMGIVLAAMMALYLAASAIEVAQR